MRIRIDKERIRQNRARVGWTQERLAEEAGIHARTLQRVESEGVASVQTLHAIAQALSADPHVMLADETAPPEPGVAPKGAVLAVRYGVKESERIERWLSYGWLGNSLLALGGALLIAVLWMVEANLSRFSILNVLLPGAGVGMVIMGQGAYLMSLYRRAEKEKRILRTLDGRESSLWLKLAHR